MNLEDENDSPRGRIVLMRALVDGVVALDGPTVQTRIDRCLGCRACETACPSGVPYGQLLEATRATLREVRPTPFIGRQREVKQLSQLVLRLELALLDARYDAHPPDTGARNSTWSAAARG